MNFKNGMKAAVAAIAISTLAGCATDGMYHGSMIAPMYQRAADPDSWKKQNEVLRSMSGTVVTVGGKAYRVRGASRVR